MHVVKTLHYISKNQLFKEKFYIQYWTKHLQPTSSNTKKCS